METGTQLNNKITVVGMDPSSYRNCGWAVVSVDSLEDLSPKLVAKYTQKLTKDENDFGRLRDIYNEFKIIVETYKPSVLAVERSSGGGLIFVRNNLSETVGVTKLACYDLGIKVAEVSPAHLKKIITGHGRGKKKDIKSNIMACFGINKKAGSEHELDAAAMALCHIVDLGWKGYKVAVPYKG